MTREQLETRIEQLQEQRQSQPYNAALEAELYELGEQLVKTKLSQHTRELAAFIAKEKGWI